jgi:hypothetical protein
MALRFTLCVIVASILNMDLVSAQQSPYFYINGKTQKVEITQCADLTVTAGTKVTYVGANVVTWELYKDNVRIFDKSNHYAGLGNAFDGVSVAIPPQAGTYKMTATSSLGGKTEFPLIVVLSALNCPSKPTKVVAMLCYKDHVLTAFEGGGIYSSSTGLNLGGGPGTTVAYPGPQRVRAMLLYNGSVITAFEGGGIYSSSTGLNLGGGPGTIDAYPGPQRVTAMLSYNGRVITAFEGGGIYSSSTGLNLGGGPGTTAVYPGPQKVRAMLSCQGRVFTAFEGGGIYSSATGLNLGGGPGTISVYP